MFHVSGFKLCESDWRNSEVEPETWNLKLETPLPDDRRFTPKSSGLAIAAEVFMNHAG